MANTAVYQTIVDMKQLDRELEMVNIPRRPGAGGNVGTNPPRRPPPAPKPQPRPK
jgi:hypothetical protein